MPRVSVITPTHNRAPLLNEAIESVLNQTFQDWELIVIDDGSTDNTRSVAEEYVKKDSRIHYVYQPKGGLSGIRAQGVSLARGEFIAFLDDDDAFYPEKLERQVEYLEKNQEVGLVYSYVDMVDRAKNFLSTWPTKPAQNFIELVRECTIQPNSALVRRECFERLGSFRTDLRSCDDYDMWLRVARVYPIIFLPVHAGIYRWHDHNMSFNWKRRCQSYVQIFKWWLGQDLTETERSEIVLSALRITYLNAIEAFERQDYRKAAFYFWMSLRFNPFIGTLVPWSRFSNRLYRFLKPYAAYVYCHFLSLRSPHEKREVGYAKT